MLKRNYTLTSHTDSSGPRHEALNQLFAVGVNAESGTTRYFNTYSRDVLVMVFCDLMANCADFKEAVAEALKLTDEILSNQQ